MAPLVIATLFFGFYWGEMAFGIAAANPRHAHEGSWFRETRLPEDRGIVRGGIDSGQPLRTPHPGDKRQRAFMRRHVMLHIALAAWLPM